MTNRTLTKCKHIFAEIERIDRALIQMPDKNPVVQLFKPSQQYGFACNGYVDVVELRKDEVTAFALYLGQKRGRLKQQLEPLVNGE